MDIIIVGAIGALLLIVVLGLVFIVLRRRSAAQSAKAKSKPKTKKSARKKQSQTTAQKQNRRRKSSSAQSAKTPKTSASSGPGSKQPLEQPSSAGHAHPAPVEESKAPPGEKIRILIVDDNAGTRENVSRLLYFEDDLEVVGQGMNGLQGIEMALDLKPHIVLMDINMPDMDGITATQEIRSQMPFSQVVIMSVQDDQHYMKRAMAAGARYFQSKPFTSVELVGCIRRVYTLGLPSYQQFEAAEQAKAAQKAIQTGTNGKSKKTIGAPVIVVYGPKGGVGTSAIATNLAVALQQKLGNIVLMDGVLQFGDLMVHLNTKLSRTMCDLIHENGLEVDLLPDILVPHESGLKLLLAPAKPDLAEAMTPPMMTEIINSLKNQFKAVVVDTSSILDDATLAILDKADYLMVVTIPELPAIKDTRLFLEVVKQLEFDANWVQVVINRANEPGGIRPSKVAQVLSLDHTYQIPQDRRLEIAMRKGVSICLQDATAPSAVAITEMSQQMWQTLNDAEVVSKEDPV